MRPSLAPLVAAPQRLRQAQQRRLLGIWVLLGVARVLVVLLPDRIVLRRLGDDVGPGGAAAEGADRDDARRIGYLVDRAAARTPWRSECYPQALVAAHLLRRAGIAHTVSLGVRRGDGLQAHAWVQAGRVDVVGTAGAPGFVVVGRFPWSP